MIPGEPRSETRNSGCADQSQGFGPVLPSRATAGPMPVPQPLPSAQRARKPFLHAGSSNTSACRHPAQIHFRRSTRTKRSVAIAQVRTGLLHSKARDTQR